MTPQAARRAELAGLAGVTALAAVLRLWHLGHGLPEAPHVDSFKFVGEAARMLATGDWSPQLYQHPQLYPRLLAALSALLGVDGEVGRHLVGRAISAAAGLAAVPAAWRLGRIVAGPAAAVLAALVVALDPGAVTVSRMVAPDALMMALAAWALVLLFDPRRRVGAAAAAGALLGLAVATKLSAMVLLPWLAAAPLLLSPDRRRWRDWLGRAAAGLLAAAVAAAAASPHLLLDARDYADRLRLEAAIQRGGQIGRVQGGALDLLWSPTPTWEQPWLGTSLGVNLGPPALLLALGGLALLLLGRGGRRGFLLAAVAVAFLAVLVGPGRLKAYRFILPALPAMAAAAGWVVDRLGARAGRWRTPVVATLVVVAIAVPAWRSGRYLVATTRPTSVTVAARWFSEQVPPGTTVFLSPFFVDALARPELDVVRLPSVGGRQYRLPEALGPSPERRPIYDAALVDRLAAHGVDLVVLSSSFDGAFAPVPENQRFFPRSVAAYAAFRERLAARADLVWSVQGWSAGRIGPDVEVWALRRPSRFLDP